MHDRTGLNIFNLFMTALFAVLLGAIGTLLILATAGVFAPDESFNGMFSESLSRLESSDTNQSVINYAIGGGLILIGLVTLMIQMVLLSEREHLVRIQESPEGDVSVARESIKELAERSMCADRAVVSCDCSLDEVEGELVIACRAKVMMGAEMTRVTAEGQKRIKDAVENLLNVRVREVSVNAKYVGSRKGRLVAAE